MRLALLLLLLGAEPGVPSWLRNYVGVTPDGTEVAYVARNPNLGLVFQASAASGPLKVLIDLSDPSAQAQVEDYLHQRHFQAPRREPQHGKPASVASADGRLVLTYEGRTRLLAPPALYGEAGLQGEVVGYSEKGTTAVVAAWRQSTPDVRVFMVVPLP